MKHRLLFFNVLFLYSCIVSYSQEQIFRYDVSKVSVTNTNRIVLKFDSGIFNSFDGCDINRAYIDAHGEDFIRIPGLNVDELHELEFFMETNNSEILYGIEEISVAGTNRYSFSFENNEFGINHNSDSQIALVAHEESEQFRIIVCDDKYSFLKNGVVYYEFDKGQDISSLSFFVSVVHAPVTDVLMHVLAKEDCSDVPVWTPTVTPQDAYAVLNTKVPNSETLLIDKLLRFYYLEKYAIESDKNDKIRVRIYDNIHNEVVPYPIYLDNKMGSNYQEVNLADYVEEEVVIKNWLVEIENANKGLVYYLRISDPTNE